MKLRDFRYFLAVAEELSFSRAARALHMASSPLSRHVARLEAELGLTLFSRTTRSVQLTEAGKYLFDEIRGVEESMERVTRTAQKIHSGAIGTLTIGYSGSAAYDVVPKIIRSFSKVHSSAVVEIVGEMDSRRQVEALASGHLSVGFVRDLEMPKPLESARVLSEPLILLIPDSHPLARAPIVSVTDLRTEPLISFARTTEVSKAVDGTCRRAGFEPWIVSRAKESFAMACMVAAERGIGLAPAAAQHLKLDGLTHRSLPVGESDFVHLNMVWPRDQQSKLLSAFKRTALAVSTDLAADEDISIRTSRAQIMLDKDRRHI